MIKTMTRFAVLLLAITGFTYADEVSREEVKDIVFESLSEDEQIAAAAQLQALADESLPRAEQMIKEDGGLVPFAYLGSHGGEGQYAWFDDSQQVQPEVAAQAVQRAIIEGAFKGNLAASVLYMTSAAPEGLDAAARERLGDKVDDDLSFEDMRFLIVEMQHLAGLGILKIIPYWEEDGEWVFGPSQEQQIDPTLHLTVRQAIQQAQQSGE